MKDAFKDSTIDMKLGEGYKKPGLAQVCILFSIIVVLFLLMGYRVQSGEFYSGILVTEFLLISGPPFIFLLLGRYDLVKVLRLNKLSILNAFIIIFLMLMAIPLAGIINMANLWIVNSIFGRISLPQIPAATDLPGLLLNVLVIGGAAGICEELAFRGTIQRGMERFGTAKAVLITAFLFALLHMDFQKIFGTFILGALIGFIVHRTNSLYAGMLAHFTNNASAVVISFISFKFNEMLGGSGVAVPESQNLADIFSSFNGIPRIQLIFAIMIWGVVFFFVAAGFAALLFAFMKNTQGLQEITPRPRSSWLNTVKGLIWLLPGIALVVIIYSFQALRFGGIDSELINIVLRILGA